MQGEVKSIDIDIKNHGQPQPRYLVDSTVQCSAVQPLHWVDQYPDWDISFMILEQMNILKSRNSQDLETIELET